LKYNRINAESRGKRGKQKSMSLLYPKESYIIRGVAMIFLSSLEIIIKKNL